VWCNHPNPTGFSIHQSRSRNPPVSDIAYMTPQSVHFGSAPELLLTRQATLDGAFRNHPLRFMGKRPQPQALPVTVWINPPIQETTPSPTPITTQ